MSEAPPAKITGRERKYYSSFLRYSQPIPQQLSVEHYDKSSVGLLRLYCKYTCCHRIAADQMVPTRWPDAARARRKLDPFTEYISLRELRFEIIVGCMRSFHRNSPETFAWSLRKIHIVLPSLSSKLCYPSLMPNVSCSCPDLTPLVHGCQSSHHKTRDRAFVTQSDHIFHTHPQAWFPSYWTFSEPRSL